MLPDAFFYCSKKNNNSNYYNFFQSKIKNFCQFTLYFLASIAWHAVMATM